MFALALAGAIAAAAVSISQVIAAPPSQAAGEVLPGRYIVVLEDGAVLKGKKGKDAGPAAVAKDHGVAPDFVYGSALRGFAGPAAAKQAKALAADPRVASVEPDRTVRALAQSLPTGVDRIDADANPTAAIGEDGGEVPVTVAIIDTGIDLDHPDLNVATGLGMTCASGKPSFDDQNGHGSHVAGSVAALDNETGVVGVAPGAPVAPVRVLSPNGSGSLSCVIAGIDHVTANAEAIAVANMSLGWQGNSPGARTAIQGSVEAGVVYAVAAGNESDDVYGPDGEFGSGDEYEPASYPEVAAISALADSDGSSGGGGGDTAYGPDDSFATFSNFSAAVVGENPVESPGKAVDLLLPGVAILSTYKDGGYATASGTSMASPHAAGLAALHIAANGRASDAAGVATIRQALIDAGRDQASGLRLAHPETEPDEFPEPLGWAGSSVVNAAPTAADASATTDEDSPVTVTLEGADPESCELDFSIVSGPTSGSLGAIGDEACTAGEPNSDSATVEYTPDPDFNGEDSFVFRVTDGDGAFDEATVTITVNAVNDAPVANDDSASTDVDTSVTVNVLANDSDVDGDSLTIDRYDAESAAGGSVSCDTETGECAYTPAEGFSGEDSFAYEATDGELASNTATVTIGVSSPPSAEAVSTSTKEDSPVPVTLEGADPESCELDFSIVSGPASGSLGAIGDEACVEGEPNNDSATVDYTPEADFNGEDSFVFKVTDGDGASDEATVTVTVEAVNDAPVAEDDAYSTGEGETLAVEAPGVLGNDSDVDGDSLAASLVSGPSNGTLELNADGSLAYEPETGFSGEDSFAYEASDGALVSNTATVTIAVEAAAPSGFLDDFEGDVSGWSASGFWHLADDTECVTPGYVSATHSFYFGSESKCSYKDGRKQVLGALTSPELAVGAEATLTFGSWREVESYSGGAYDKTWVEVSHDGGASWTTVWYRDSTDPSLVEWTTESVALSPSGETALVRFRFDTVDGVANEYRGWLIDDVAVG
ncbi:MAG: Ig-like domain-containing protein [Solirubrobacterales bacterium]